jgi:FkbM family methyltransferase
VYVLQFARWSAPDGFVLAFEPNPGARVSLRRHIALNQLEARVEVDESAVGERSGTTVLFAEGANGMSRIAVPNPELGSRAKPIDVRIVTLDDVFRERSRDPDWLLIDIEGFELSALMGARRMIARRGRSLGIVVELHPGAWSAAGADRDAAERLLDDLSLRAVPLTGQRDPLGEYGIVHLDHV